MEFEYEAGRYKMETKTIAVLDPTAKPKHPLISPAHRVFDLNGKVIGFLWNEKPNGNILLDRIKERLSQKFHLSGTIWHSKETASRPASPVILNDLTGRADLVINAIGD
jgi:hypothetical protein